MGRVNNKKIIFTDLSANESISVTGTSCALNCAHCNKKFLKHMKRLEEKINSSTTSILVSGGCDKEGRVPILNFPKQIKKLKEKYKINAHAGLVSDKEAKKIAPMVDAISFDFTTELNIIKKVYKLNKKISDYYHSMSALKNVTEVFPHLTIGLWQGKITWEYKAVKILVKEFKFKDLVFNIFIPAVGTEMENQKPPSISAVKKYFLFLQKNYPNITKRLGCMRPGGNYRNTIDKIAMKTGFKVITKPTRIIKEFAKKQNYQISLQHKCCIFCND
ncbi:MAG: hypothetical protein U9Q63_01695 [Patescibacteria group bacterium]|nr:hypothetical protein [Patescibacteria group bacterium]